MSADLGEYRSARERADWRGAWVALHNIEHPELRAIAEREWWQRMNPRKVSREARWWVRPSDGEGGYCKSTAMRAIEATYTTDLCWAELGQRRILDQSTLARIDMDGVRRALCEEMIARATDEWFKRIGTNIEVTRDLISATNDRDANRLVDTINEWAMNVRELMTVDYERMYNHHIVSALATVADSIRGKDVAAFARIEHVVGSDKANAVVTQLILEAVKEVMR